MQDKLEHLELLDGVVIDLLKTKWESFVKSRFYKQFYMFSFYFLFSLISFISRPGPSDKKDDDDDEEFDNGGVVTSSPQAINGSAAFHRGDEWLPRLIKRAIAKMEYSELSLNCSPDAQLT